VGTYTIRALIDQNNNRMLDRNEKWDTSTVTVVDTRPYLELLAIERDSTPPALESITPIDSVTLRVSFDKVIDPRVPLQPALVRIQRTDSSQMEIARVQWQSQYDREKTARDSARRADSLKALPPTAAPPTPAPPPPPTPVVETPNPATRGAPPPPKPSRLPPDRGIVITLAPPGKFVPLETYRLTTLAMRNLVGNSRDASRAFTIPKPPPPRVTTDTTKKPPATPPRRPPPHATR
jgi:hypothetical protein